MDKIETGEYVRTDKGYIFHNLSSKQISGLKLLSKQYGNIAKHSENPIDLVKVGDILEIYFPIRKTMLKIFVDEYFKDSMIFSGIIQKRINLKSILTKEMYEQNCYKVEE